MRVAKRTTLSIGLELIEVQVIVESATVSGLHSIGDRVSRRGAHGVSIAKQLSELSRLNTDALPQLLARTDKGVIRSQHAIVGAQQVQIGRQSLLVRRCGRDPLARGCSLYGNASLSAGGCR